MQTPTSESTDRVVLWFTLDGQLLEVHSVHRDRVDAALGNRMEELSHDVPTRTVPLGGVGVVYTGRKLGHQPGLLTAHALPGTTGILTITPGSSVSFTTGESTDAAAFSATAKRMPDSTDGLGRWLVQIGFAPAAGQWDFRPDMYGRLVAEAHAGVSPAAATATDKTSV